MVVPEVLEAEVEAATAVLVVYHLHHRCHRHPPLRLIALGRSLVLAQAPVVQEPLPLALLALQLAE
jgi:hypothetical protein